jgi:hypothetical protein
MSMNDDILRDLFPLPEGTKLRKPRFGTAGPSKPQPLPPAGDSAASGGADFSLDWTDEHLQLEVRCRREGDDLVVSVTCHDPALKGQAVSVFLLGSIQGHRLRKTVLLDETAPAGCAGKGSFGKIAQIARELGTTLAVVAHLLISA